MDSDRSDRTEHLDRTAPMDPGNAGRMIGPYRLIRHLGSGGMGAVYRAEDTRLGRPMALKLLPEALTADSESRTRFLDEACAAASLDHPNICMIYEFDEFGGRWPKSASSPSWRRSHRRSRPRMHAVLSTATSRPRTLRAHGSQVPARAVVACDAGVARGARPLDGVAQRGAAAPRGGASGVRRISNRIRTPRG